MKIFGRWLREEREILVETKDLDLILRSVTRHIKSRRGSKLNVSYKGIKWTIRFKANDDEWIKVVRSLNCWGKLNIETVDFQVKTIYERL